LEQILSSGGGIRCRIAKKILTASGGARQSLFPPPRFKKNSESN
jgi:hypothetical protein